MKGITKTHYLFALFLFVAISCKNDAKKTAKFTTQTNQELNIAGNYVSKSYLKKSEGYDWVAVSVREAENGQIKISIRSRADKKKPTCTFDAVARKVDDKTYQSQINGKTMLFEFTNKEISITTKEKEDKSLLHFYCSGGASIGGTYSKINEPLDTM